MGLVIGSGSTGHRHRLLRAASAVLVGALSLGVTPGAQAAPPSEPRVVLVVGPAGSLTDEYRAAAQAGARVARRYTHNVVTIYSPDATWPVVKAALQGASIVVYLGHGNGWPSRYRDHLYPPTQNGLGLNPVAGQGDVAHQYFGEAYLARDIRLAPHAVVLLHHLCYASGNTEPGLPEGTLDDARQRADNFAAGWLAAGADSVLADAFFGPAWYIKAILGGSRSGSIESIWRNAPSFHDHVIGYASTRTAGRNALLDPTAADHGFYRSLVGKLTLRPAEVLGGAGSSSGRGSTGSASRDAASPAPATDPVPAIVRAEFTPPVIAPADGISTGLVAGSTVTIALPFKLPVGARLAGSLELGFRWDTLALDPPQVLPETAGLSPSASAGAAPPLPSPSASAGAPPPSPAPSASAGTAPPSPAPSASAGTASPSPAPLAVTATGMAPSIESVVPETPADVVATVPAIVVGGKLVAKVSLPIAPGRYRLRTTIHDADGIALDTRAQERIASLVVRVSPPVSVAFGVAGDLSLAAGSRTSLHLRVANDGARPWSDPNSSARGARGPADGAPPSLVMATWAAVGAGVDTSALLAAAEVRLRPGEETTVELQLLAPDDPGNFLLLLDLMTPSFGSLAATGVTPTTIRVEVVAAPNPVPR